jgi:DNA polymerase
MGESISASLHEKLMARLGFYEDLGIRLFYADRQPSAAEIHNSETPLNTIREEESTLQRTRKLAARGNQGVTLPSSSGPSGLHEVIDQSSAFFKTFAAIPDENLPLIQEDLGECTRCKLHKTRNKIVFGDGNPKAKLMFVGEGPGADEDAQGLPFVGRAGKLLTQMIQAMGLQRSDVYICNVVKCRPPQNRQPEKDEVSTCSPFLLRQIDTIQPQVIVCLGATAAKLLLDTDQGISQFRGKWMDFRGRRLMATYHPAYLLRNPAAKSEVWKDLQKVMTELGLEIKKNKPAV